MNMAKSEEVGDQRRNHEIVLPPNTDLSVLAASKIVKRLSKTTDGIVAILTPRAKDDDIHALKNALPGAVYKIDGKELNDISGSASSHIPEGTPNNMDASVQIAVEIER